MVIPLLRRRDPEIVHERSTVPPHRIHEQPLCLRRPVTDRLRDLASSLTGEGVNPDLEKKLLQKRGESEEMASPNPR